VSRSHESLLQFVPYLFSLLIEREILVIERETLVIEREWAAREMSSRERHGERKGMESARARERPAIMLASRLKRATREREKERERQRDRVCVCVGETSHNVGVTLEAGDDLEGERQRHTRSDCSNEYSNSHSNSHSNTYSNTPSNTPSNTHSNTPLS